MDDYCGELTAKLGIRVSTDPQICRAYDHDLGEMPSVLLKLFRRTPKAVVLPISTTDVSTALAIAHRYNVPVTPRAQASSGYGGAMPTRGGIVVDVSRMRAILSVDEEGQSCTVQPGVVWTDLEEELQKKGLALRICPTSGPSSTVGGLFAMGGMGIGSVRYGTILDVVNEIEVVDPDGRVHTVSGRELELYAFSQGSLGIITSLRLLCRKNLPLTKVALHLPDPSNLPKLLLSLKDLNPYSLSLLSASYCAMQSAVHRKDPVISQGYLMLAVFEGEIEEEKLEGVLARAQAERLSDEIAAEEWEMRFYPMRIKRNGPALLVGEYCIDARHFAAVAETITKKLSKDVVGFEAFVNWDMKLSVLIYIQDSSEDLLSLFRMGKAMVPLHVASSYGGTVYATGLWFNSRTASVLGPARMRALRKKKCALDPRNLMNSGKCCGGFSGFWPFALLSWGIWIGTKLMAPISSLLRAKPRRIHD